MATRVTGEQANRIWAKLGEIQRQVYLQLDGYPFDPNELEVALQGVVEGRFGNSRITPTGFIIVDYSLDLGQMIAAGRYDWTNSDITAKRFPISGTGVVQFETKLFHFSRDISSDEAERRITADDPTNPWQLAKIEHTLCYGATFPKDQRGFPVVGLGSVASIRGSSCVAYLGGSVAGRRLDLLYRGHGWGPSFRFLGVRKVQNSGS